MDKVEICNIALNHIGVATIERLDEANQHECAGVAMIMSGRRF